MHNPLRLPSAQLNFKKIQTADRATYLLNYLYLQIQEEQLLQDNHQATGNEKLDIFKECFLVCLKPYLKILNDWVCKGEDDLSTHDFRQEFFIKANNHIFTNEGSEENEATQNARKQWSESYVFRTINISQLLGQALGENFGNMLDQNDEENEPMEEMQQLQSDPPRKDHIELSCPVFLRPLMKQILSVGKSIKIVRYLENSSLEQLKKSKMNSKADPASSEILESKANFDLLSFLRKNVSKVGFASQIKDRSIDYLN